MDIKIITLFLTILTAILLLSGTAAAFSGNGAGTPENPYQVTTVVQLKEIQDELDASYILMNDAPLEINADEVWVSIGNDGQAFTGTFDGNNKTILMTGDVEFTHSGGSGSYGLFGNVGNNAAGAELKNIQIIVNGNLTNGNKERFGVLLGAARGGPSYSDVVIIENCSVTFEGDSSISIVSGDHLGGLAGSFENGTISGCFVTGGTVDGGAEVAGINAVGGLVGSVKYADILESYVSGSTVKGVNNIGGLIGWSELTDISSCYADVDVRGRQDVGGLVGHSNSGDTVLKSNASGTVSGKLALGGLVGSIDKGDILECYATCNVTAEEQHAGGLVGWFRESNISMCYADADVRGRQDVGGLVGHSPEDGNITASYASGTVVSKEGAGGLVGSLNSGSISECYSICDVSAEFNVGGLVGWCGNSEIFQSFVLGLISFTGGNEDDIGGIVGKNNGGSVVVTDCFYIEENVHNDDNGFGIGVSESDLKILSTFTEHPELEEGSWLISSSPGSEYTWYINEDMDYPMFYWQYEAPAENEAVKSGGGSGFGRAFVVDSASEIAGSASGANGGATVIQTTQPNANLQEDDPEIGYEIEEHGSGRTLFFLLFIGLVAVIGSVSYSLNRRQND